MKTSRSNSSSPCLQNVLILLLLLTASSLPAAIRTVSNLNDSGPGSLRDDISASVTGDVINFSVNGTIILTSGELVIGRDLTILGPSTGVTVSGNNSSRVFNIVSGSVTISNLTVTQGRIAGTNGFSPTSALTPPGDGESVGGGGILNSGILLLDSCTVSYNTAIGGNGGTNLVNATAFNGPAGGFAEGGGLLNGGFATLVNCTFSGNSTIGGNGGNGSSGGNGGSAGGGAIMDASGIQIANCSLIANSVAGGSGGRGLHSSSGGSGGDGQGGNYYEFVPESTVINTIIAQGRVTAGAAGLGVLSAGANGIASDPDVTGGITSQGHNLLGVLNSDSTGWVSSDISGTDAAPLNPAVAPLANNGGPTLTFALLPASAAIDGGDDSVLGPPFNLATDQRGLPRKYGNHVDIGAYEFSQPRTLLVTNLNDSGPGSLRQSIINAFPGDTVAFAPNLSGTLTLQTGELQVPISISIQGPGAKTVAINSASGGRVFDITGLNTAISGFTLFGSGPTDACVRVFGGSALSLGFCQIISNACAGIYTEGSLAVYNSTFAWNTNVGFGGGIAHWSGSTAVTNCTFSANSGRLGGGIFFNGGALSVCNSTIANNLAHFSQIPARQGGGIANFLTGNRVYLFSTIVAGNTAQTAGPDVLGDFLSGGYNFIGKGDGSSNLVNGVDQDQVGSSAAPLDPLLGPLQDNGGPTPTHALLFGSTAIDKGLSGGLFVDQRGGARILDFTVLQNSAFGDGTDIGAFELGGYTRITQIQRSNSDILVSFTTDPGVLYALVARTNEASGSWTTMVTNLLGTGSIITATNSGGLTAGKPFYRVQALPTTPPG